MSAGVPWSVLVLLGASGTGKSTAAATIARERGITWMQVDDLRLALQYSRVSLPERTERLYAFLDAAGIWERPLSDIRQAFIHVAEALVPAVRIVIENHVAIDAPMVIEGDGVLPSLIADPAIVPLIETGAVRMCCVTEASVDALLENMLARGRGIEPVVTPQARRHASANEAFGEWLAEESRRLGIPVVPSRPFGTLVDRVLNVIS